ncbi:GNAT family N-acetyltransferase [Desulfobacula toluolica]|uniref:Conserved uncharacterized protein n=1 Tax=Desulfobacula toluolica (strain DSM 7467 / Tol2) TaxID=651182 RepID=K0N956_DESTT|nr:GNAT family N-acetyltransferase [Desulfobacula toluolica]CCK80474.1 conserved uncharacterized protein [Desulfobacula toluolica Tol2]
MKNNWKIKDVTSLEELANFKVEVDSLALLQDSYQPYLDFDWFVLWLKHFKKKNQVHFFLIYKGNKIQGIAPLIIKKERYKGINVVKLQIIGNVYSPVKLFLFKSKDLSERKEFVARFFNYIAKNIKWDIMDFDAIPEEHDLYKAINEWIVSNRRYKTKPYSCFGNWYSRGKAISSDIFFKNRSRNLRASIKKNYKKTRKKGEMQFIMVKHPDGIEEYINIYFDVYSKSWKKNESVGPHFYIDLMNGFARKGLLRLGIVMIEDKPVAAGFAIVHNKVACFEKTAYDKEFLSLGVGGIWLTEMIKYVLDTDKVVEIDFLRGDDAYKKRWMENRRERRGLIIYNNSLKGRIASICDLKIWPAIKRNKNLYGIIYKFINNRSGKQPHHT